MLGGSHPTRRWREADSNLRSPLEGGGFEPSVPLRRTYSSKRFVRPFQQFPSERDRGFESGSLQQTVRLSPAAAFEGREPCFPRGFGQLACRPGQQRLPGCFDIASTGGNISVGPYSSTAVRLVVAPGLTRGKIVRSLNSHRAQAKPSTIRLIVPGTWQNGKCSRSFSAAKSPGCRPSRIALVISGAR